jgi:hypothetical protein
MPGKSLSPAVAGFLKSLPVDRRRDIERLRVVGEIVASTPVDRWVEIAEAARRRGPGKKKAKTKKT